MNGLTAVFGRLFLNVVNASIAASWLILVILVVRFCLKHWMKRVPKWTLLLLWAIVGIRLLLPISFRTEISLLPSAETFPVETIYNENPEISNNPVYLRLDSGVAVIDRTVPTQKVASGYVFRDRITFAGLVWIIGMMLTLLYMHLASLKLKRNLRDTIPVGEGILESDEVSTPFILGVIRPCIYLPSDLTEPDRSYVLAHETAHLHRRDHVWKLIGYLIRMIHWFNPLVWLSYTLFQRDLELACDEAAIKSMGFADKKAYSKALLDCGIYRQKLFAHPLAFGEIGVRERVDNVLHYRKPAAWEVPVVAVCCLLLSACFLTSPLRREIAKTSEQYTAMLYEQKEDVLKALELTQDEVMESPLRTIKLPYQEYMSGKPYVVNLVFNDEDTLNGFCYSTTETDADKAFTEYDALVRRMIERFGDPVADTAFGNSYLINLNHQNRIKSSALRMFSEEWHLEQTNLKEQNYADRDGLILRTSIRYSKQYDNYTIQMYITVNNRRQNG